jgi:uncharacterized protein (DUF488 family)
MRFADPETVQQNLVSGSESRVVAGFDCADKIDAGNHRKLPDDRHFTRDGKRVLIIQTRLFVRHCDIAIRQTCFVKTLKSGLIRALTFINQNCFEHKPTSETRAGKLPSVELDTLGRVFVYY